MPKLSNIRDNIQQFSVESYYEPADLIRVLGIMEQLLSVIEEQDDEIRRISNELGQHLNE
jgi:hypothetical protein